MLGYYKKDFVRFIDKMKPPKTFILDVDGVLTSGGFFYSKNGKYLKMFGPDDNDGLKLISKKVEILFITGDKKI